MIERVEPNEIIIDIDVKVELSYQFKEGELQEIEITKEVCIPLETNYYTDSVITLNKEDAIKLVEFIQANLHLLK